MKINHFAPAGDINPIKPNLVRHSLGEGGFKRDTLLLCGVLLRTSFAGATTFRRNDRCNTKLHGSQFCCGGFGEGFYNIGLEAVNCFVSQCPIFIPEAQGKRNALFAGRDAFAVIYPDKANVFQFSRRPLFNRPNNISPGNWFCDNNGEVTLYCGKFRERLDFYGTGLQS